MALPQGHGLPDDGDGVDRISGIPEELLLQVLVRLGCAREAARTAVLARRWRELPTRLPEYTFRGLDPETAEAALDRVTRPTLDLLDIEPELDSEAAIGRAPSLLRAAARRNPERFSAKLWLGGGVQEGAEAIELPCFDRARSLVLFSMLRFSFTPSGAAAFSRLESLEFATCHAIPDALLPSCPCLRVLRVCVFGQGVVVTVRSATLEELAVKTIEHGEFSIDRVDVEAPLLKHAKLDIDVTDTLSMSFSAPAVENLFCVFRPGAGDVGLPELILGSVKYCLRLGIRTLLLNIFGWHFMSFAPKRSFAQEIARLQVVDFSVLMLVLALRGHAFGPLLLGLLQIRPVIRELHLVYLNPKLGPEYKAQVCTQNCSCRQPTNWKNENISLPDLEEVIICYGMEIGDEEVDLLQLLFRCAPGLKRISVGVPGNGIQEIRRICKKYPDVECDVSHNCSRFI